MDPKGKATAPTPPYRRDAKKGYLPSDDFPHVGPEPSGYAPRSFLSRNSLEGLTCGVGIGFERDIVEVEVGGPIMGRGLQTAAPVVSPIGLDAFWFSLS